VQLLDGGNELGVGFDRLFHVQDIALDEIDGFVHFFHLGAQTLHQRVVKRRRNIRFAEKRGAVGEDRVGVWSDQTVIEAGLRMHGRCAE